MKLILIYTLVAGVLAALTAPIPGTSLLLTALEVFMIVHLAKVNEFKLGMKEIGYSAAAIWGISTVLRDTALEILTFFPGIGWVAEVIIAVLFVFFLGSLVNMYFKKPNPSRHEGTTDEHSHRIKE
jgi:uncharacterized protein (DUF697 family)